jgi:hypothetical protein
LIAQLVELLRRHVHGSEAEVEGADVPEATAEGERPFAVWNLGVKGPLSREEIYDHL